MLLLDSHIVIWLAQETDRISARALDSMHEERLHGQGLAIAAITLWEIALLSAKGRLRFDPSVEVFLERVESTYHVMPLERKIALRSMEFSSEYPQDPADRQIAATAIVHGLTLVTADKLIRKSGEVPCIW